MLQYIEFCRSKGKANLKMGDYSGSAFIGDCMVINKEHFANKHYRMKPENMNCRRCWTQLFYFYETKIKELLDGLGIAETGGVDTEITSNEVTENNPKPSKRKKSPKID